jgi:hypothetical protein
VTGSYNLVVGPDVRDTFGNPMDQNGNFVPGENPGDRFTTSFGISGPRVIASTPGGNVKGTVKSVRVTFDRAMAPGTFTTADVVSFTGPGGAIAVKSVSAVSGSNNTQFTITFTNQGARGSYALVLGPNIQDTFGNQMDQNGNLTPGEVPGDRFTAAFAIVKGNGASPGNGPAGGTWEPELSPATGGDAGRAGPGQPPPQAPAAPIQPTCSTLHHGVAAVDQVFAAAGRTSLEAVLTAARSGAAATADDWWVDLFLRHPWLWKRGFPSLPT